MSGDASPLLSTPLIMLIKCLLLSWRGDYCINLVGKKCLIKKKHFGVFRILYRKYSISFLFYMVITHEKLNS